MNYLPLLLVYTLPLIASAQRSQKSGPPAPVAAVPSEQGLRGSLHTHVLQLAAKTVLYRQLRDTLDRHYAKKFLPGACVILRTTHRHWMKVNRAKSTRHFSADTSTYYMPIQALKGAKTYVLL